MSHKKNETVVATGNSGTQSGQGFTLGGRHNDVRHSSMKVNELARIGRVLTAAEIEDVVSSLTAKWSVI